MTCWLCPWFMFDVLPDSDSLVPVSTWPVSGVHSLHHGMTHTWTLSHIPAASYYPGPGLSALWDTSHCPHHNHPHHRGHRGSLFIKHSPRINDVMMIIKSEVTWIFVNDMTTFIIISIVTCLCWECFELRYAVMLCHMFVFPVTFISQIDLEGYMERNQNRK